MNCLNNLLKESKVGAKAKIGARSKMRSQDKKSLRMRETLIKLLLLVES